MFQFVLLLVLLFLPAAGMIHFQSTFFSGTVSGIDAKGSVALGADGKEVAHIGGWNAMSFHRATLSAGVALKYDPNVAKNIGPDYLENLGTVDLSLRHSAFRRFGHRHPALRFSLRARAVVAQDA